MDLTSLAKQSIGLLSNLVLGLLYQWGCGRNFAQKLVCQEGSEKNCRMEYHKEKQELSSFWSFLSAKIQEMLSSIKAKKPLGAEENRITDTWIHLI